MLNAPVGIQYNWEFECNIIDLSIWIMSQLA